MSETKFIKFNNGTIVNISEIQRIQKAKWGTSLIIRSTGGDTYTVSFISKQAQEKAIEQILGALNAEVITIDGVQKEIE